MRAKKNKADNLDNKKKQTNRIPEELRLPTMMTEIGKILFKRHATIPDSLSVSYEIMVASLFDSVDQLDDMKKVEELIKNTLDMMNKNVTERVMRYALNRFYAGKIPIDAGSLFPNQELEN